MLLILRNETVFRKFTDILIMKKGRKKLDGFHIWISSDFAKWCGSKKENCFFLIGIAFLLLQLACSVHLWSWTFLYCWRQGACESANNGSWFALKLQILTYFVGEVKGSRSISVLASSGLQGKWEPLPLIRFSFGFRWHSLAFSFFPSLTFIGS